MHGKIKVAWGKYNGFWEREKVEKGKRRKLFVKRVDRGITYPP